MRIHTFPIGPLETNCYLLVRGDEAVAVDPGGNPASVIQYLNTHKLRLAVILNTHLHFDHVLGNADLAKATGAPIYANKLDDFLLSSELGSGGGFGLPKTPPFEHKQMEEGETKLIGLCCKVFLTPGHTPGSLSYYFPDAGAVFAGDVLFYRSVGRTDLPGGDSNMLRESIRKKLFTLPPETAVYPGHGPCTSISAEQRGNPFIGM